MALNHSLLSPTTTSSNYSKQEEIDLFYLFQIDLDNFFDIKFALARHKLCSFDVTELLPFYEYEIYVQKLIEVLKKEQDQQDKQGEEAQSFSNPYSNADKYMRDLQRKTPNMSPKMPKFNI